MKETKEINIEFESDSIISSDEVEKLVTGLIYDAEFHPYAIYGLMFLFSSIKKLNESGNYQLLEKLYSAALKEIYANSPNLDEGIYMVPENIHAVYRNTDFSIIDHQKIFQSFTKDEAQKTE